MSFFKVQQVLKKAKKVIVYDDADGMQWVGDYNAMYSLYDITGRVKPYDILEMMGVNVDQKERYVQEERFLPLKPERGEPVEQFGIPFLYDDLLYHVWSSANHTICLLDVYIKPFRNTGRSKECFIREDVNGNTWVEIWCGSMPLALISGETLMQNEGFVSRMRRQVKRIEEAFLKHPSETDLPVLNFDEETGEVLDE